MTTTVKLLSRAAAEAFAARINQAPSFIAEAVRVDGRDYECAGDAYQVKVQRDSETEKVVGEGVSLYGSAAGLEWLCQSIGR